jgi:hypothetical protein
MLTESLFADECEPFFNSIDRQRTSGLINVRGGLFDLYQLPSVAKR